MESKRYASFTKKFLAITLKITRHYRRIDKFAVKIVDFREFTIRLPQNFHHFVFFIFILLNYFLGIFTVLTLIFLHFVFFIFILLNYFLGIFTIITLIFLQFSIFFYLIKLIFRHISFYVLAILLN